MSESRVRKWYEDRKARKNTIAVNTKITATNHNHITNKNELNMNFLTTMQVMVAILVKELTEIDIALKVIKRSC